MDATVGRMRMTDGGVNFRDMRAYSVVLVRLDEKQDVMSILILTNTFSSSALEVVYSQSVIMVKYFAITMTDRTLSIITQ